MKHETAPQMSNLPQRGMKPSEVAPQGVPQGSMKAASIIAGGQGPTGDPGMGRGTPRNLEGTFSVINGVTQY